MDVSIFYSLSAIFLPLVFALYLLIARVRLSFVSKGVLNNTLIFINSISLALFCYLFYFITREKIEIESFTNIFALEKISFDFGFRIDETNVKFLVASSLIYLLLSLYAKFYFEKKKQFIFTKQRMYIFLSFLIFNTYAFFVSPNLFQSLLFWILQGFLIYIFSYFDIFKKPTNFNITRFARISLIGEFAYLSAVLVLLKYAILSEGCIHSLSLDFGELNALISYAYGISEPAEFIACAIAFLIAIMSKMFIFPLNCYYSFFANSSNIFYLATYACANCFLGAFLYLKVLPFFDLFKENILHFEVFILATALFSLLFILFEKSYKIIFGHLFSILNAGFMILYLIFEKNNILYGYFGASLFLLLVLMFLFLNDKVSFNRRLINIQSGFMLERIHIFIFENLGEKIFRVVNFIDKKVMQNIADFLVALTNYFLSLFDNKTNKTSHLKVIRNIFIIFGLFAIFTIIIALFGRFR